jgi:serine/threonine-protein kinase
MSLRPGEPFDRYRIEGLLGHGGMGQVYRARDERLRRQVALKIISTAPGTDGAARLLREARAAAAIDHPNAIAIFDVGEVDGTPFLAMELVDGSTLRGYVGEASVPVSQRLHWLLAIARALAAAHRRGIVHRDIKPENVMVRSDGLVKVLDFGIARAVVPPGSMGAEGGAPIPIPTLSAASLLSADSTFAGTPLYMSPEHLRGEPIDGRSDQFAWGVLAWELLSGRLPWATERGGAGIVQEILAKEPEALASHVPVPAGVEAVVARAMAKAAVNRFETTDALVASLEAAMGIDPSVPSSVPRASMSPSARTLRSGWTLTLGGKRPVVALAGIIALTGVVAVALIVWRTRAPRTADDPTLALVTSGRRPAVAVVGAPAPGPGAERLAAIADLLATELASGDRIRVVPRDVTSRAVGPLAAERPSSELLVRLRDTTDADYVVVAVPEARGGGRVHVVLRVLGVPKAGAAPQSSEVTAEGDLDELAAVVARAGDAVRRVLGRAPLAPDEIAAMRAALPKSSVAAEAYALGLARRAHYDYPGARDAFEQAVAAEDDFALGHLELSRALTFLGLDQRALEEATRAMALSGPLGREQRLVTTAQRAVAAKDWGTATETYRALFGYFPDNLDYGIAFVRSQVYLGQRNEALAALDRLRAVPRTAVDEARLDLIEAFAAAKVGDVRRRLAASLEAKRKADALGASWIAADARTSMAEAYRDLGEIEKGATALDEARALFEQLGDRSGLAGVYRHEADLAASRSDYAGAIALADKALELVRIVGDRYRTGGLITTRGLLLARVGRFAEAGAAFDEARALYESISDTEGVAHNTGNAAEMRVARGDLRGARDAFEQALAMHRRIGMKVGIEEQLLNVGWARFLEGDAPGAGKTIEEALSDARAIGGDANIRDALVRRAQWLRARDDAAGAARDCAEAAAMADKAGDPDARAEIDLAQVRLDLDGLKDSQPVARARAALARFVEAKLPQDEALARAVVVRALVRRGAIDEAMRESEALEAVLGACELFEARVEAGLARAELAAARGENAAAARAAREAREAADGSGIVPLALEARLVEAMVASRGERAAALARVASAARGAGFVRVVRLASR